MQGIIRTSANTAFTSMATTASYHLSCREFNSDAGTVPESWLNETSSDLQTTQVSSEHSTARAKCSAATARQPASSAARQAQPSKLGWNAARKSVPRRVKGPATNRSTHPKYSIHGPSARGEPVLTYLSAEKPSSIVGKQPKKELFLSDSQLCDTQRTPEHPWMSDREERDCSHGDRLPLSSNRPKIGQTHETWRQFPKQLIGGQIKLSAQDSSTTHSHIPFCARIKYAVVPHANTCSHSRQPFTRPECIWYAASE